MGECKKTKQENEQTIIQNKTENVETARDPAHGSSWKRRMGELPLVSKQIQTTLENLGSRRGAPSRTKGIPIKRRGEKPDTNIGERFRGGSTKTFPTILRKM